MKTIKKTLFTLSLLSTSFLFSFGQDTLLVENFGTLEGQISISNYAGWQNSEIKYSGTAALRNVATTASCSNYTGQGSVLLAAHQYFQASGIQLKTDSALSISFFMYNRSVKLTPDSLKFYISSDNTSWSEVYLVSFPSAVGWGYYQINCNLYDKETLYFRVNNLSSKCLFWIDYLVVSQNTARSTSVPATALNVGAKMSAFQILSARNNSCRFTVNSDETLFVYNLAGNLVMNVPVFEGENEISIPSGMYVFRTSNGSKKVFVGN